ncbi:hypothetical protein [Paenibacillus arenilitoris]|uniref:Uncharacterized protein n=1 Tax=Paenibacillus arenilitoris TaxID=2772299 RepID=A0A927H3Y7_9BACL|nr:hypothetical protein [Paenibacillus arenilitoris]MBD2867350.1 hypothetical protein [Paenibacillus arenilitoris]
MWTVAGILLASGFILYLEAPNLARNAMMKELGIFLIVLLIGTAVGIMEAVKLPIPNPLTLITAIHKPISDMMNAFLK